MSGEASPKGCSSPDKMSHVSDSASSDSGSKGSSELTPSEQRSHEEGNSSLKESDNTSCESGSSKGKRTDTSGKAKARREPLGRTTFMKLFVPIKVEYVSMPMTDPVWVQEANFSNKVQMTYTKQNPDLGSTLRQDKQTLTYCQQPELVKSQLKELVMSIKKSQSKDSTQSCSSSEEAKKVPRRYGTVVSLMEQQSVAKDCTAVSDAEQNNVQCAGNCVAEDQKSTGLNTGHTDCAHDRPESMQLDKPQASSSEDDNFVHPSLHKLQRRMAPASPSKTQSSSSDSPDPAAQPSSDSDNWEQLRRAVKSSMTSFFEAEGKEVEKGADKKDSVGQSVHTSSEQSSVQSDSQQNTVEELMEQLFKRDDTDSIGMD